MTESLRRLRLEGLEPDNLLAFMALLGLLRALEALDGSRHPSWRPRAAWDIGRPPLRPILILAEAQTPEAICEAAAAGAALLAADYVFPQDLEDGASPQKDLAYPAKTARKLLKRAADAEDRRRADLWAALMCDKAEKDEKIEATPFCLLFGQGHQHFLDRLAAAPRTEAPSRGRGRKAAALTAAEALHESLFQPWARQDPTPAFRWDPAEDVRYALQADDPSGVKSTTQHGANRLAALGLPALTVTPTQRGERVRLQVLGGRTDRNEFAFDWPIWTAPASLTAIRALLSHPDLPGGPSRLAHLDVVEVRRARRISVGKFMNFTRAAPIFEKNGA